MSSSTAAASDNEFAIRITGVAPPPFPSAKKCKKGGGSRGKTAKNNAAQQQQQRRYNLRLRPSSSLDQLRTDVFALFNASAAVNSYHLSFLGGFPPKELDETGKRTVHELGIRPNESLIVKFALSVDAEEVAVGGDGDRKQSAAPAGRQKRASAMAATARFADVIAAQDAILKKDKKPPKKKGSSAFSAGNIAGLGNARKRISSINTAASKKPKNVKMEGAGFRLSDGKSFAGSSPSKRKSAGKRHQQAMFKSEEDVSSKLLSSLGGSGGTGGNVGKFLRSAMKGAVTKSYEASRAAVRVSAVNAGDYSFERVKGGSVVDGGGVVLGTAADHDPNTEEADRVYGELERTLYNVAYTKGMEGRGRYEEQVEVITLAALKSVLSLVYNADSTDDPDEYYCEQSKDERIRPVQIAQLSPRAFWSLVYHCSEAAEKEHQNPAQLSVEDMLRLTLPHLDWSHLDRGGRKRVLSEKARENLKQEREGTEPDVSEKPSRGSKAIEELEESIVDTAMANGDGRVEFNERERRATAAMARFENVNDKASSSSSPPASSKNEEILDDWTFVTPIEDDIDELIECIMEGVSSDGEDSTNEIYDEEDAKSWADILLPYVRNWRELANQSPEYILRTLTDKSSFLPSSENIEKWIDAAQVHSMEEIMLEIVDADQDALELLQDKARSSSPRDLVHWKSSPGMLLDVISCTNMQSTKWGKSDAIRWISRAETALDVCTWLELYTTQTAS